jgi:hypothetical protein
LPQAAKFGPGRRVEQLPRVLVQQCIERLGRLPNRLLIRPKGRLHCVALYKRGSLLRMLQRFVNNLWTFVGEPRTTRQDSGDNAGGGR